VADSLPVSLGGAAGTLAGYLEYADIAGATGDPATYAARLTDAFAAETGLAAPVLPWHSLRTPLADLAAALSLTSGALGHIAVDIETLTRTEIAEVAEPATPGRGASSAMPHKRNPVLATMMRATAIQVPPLAGALTQCLVAEDERSGGTWHAEWLLLRECLRLVGGAAHTAVELTCGLQVHTKRMRTNLDLTDSQIVSERIAARLTPGLGKVRAKEMLTRASCVAAETGRPLAVALAEVVDNSSFLTSGELEALCDPAAYVGAAPDLVDQALKHKH
ncbi:lyase family protein, partial [Micromonospora aurantiaca]|uniref:lyase family protein n=1 Tax=Micromonospora aurantiaca (nom. illeg.) TaxID=47850 RepID=UPI00364C7FF2